MVLQRPPVWIAFCLAGVGLVFALSLGLGLGSTGWGWPTEEILWKIRFPRVLGALGVGGALALAGALVQLVTRNPLSDPHILGVTGGASAGAVLTLFCFPIASGAALALGAGLGALISMSVVFTLTWRSMNRGLTLSAQPGTVLILLVGSMMGAASGAIVSLLLAMSSDQTLRGAVFWLLGDLNGVTQVWQLGVALGLGLVLTYPVARELDWISRGDSWAWTLGVPVARRRRTAMVVASLLTGTAVAIGGSIGFVGLVAPHVVRLCGLRHARHLLPFSTVFGGIFLVLADTVARTVVAPSQLPVGVVCALVGVPVFLLLLLRRRG